MRHGSINWAIAQAQEKVVMTNGGVVSPLGNLHFDTWRGYTERRRRLCWARLTYICKLLDVPAPESLKLKEDRLREMLTQHLIALALNNTLLGSKHNAWDFRQVLESRLIIYDYQSSRYVDRRPGAQLRSSPLTSSLQGAGKQCTRPKGSLTNPPAESLTSQPGKLVNDLPANRAPSAAATGKRKPARRGAAAGKQSSARRKGGRT